MTNFLIKKFVKDYKSTELAEVRGQYGMLSGIAGIIVNTLLFLLKLTTGIIINSVSIMADSFNNLSDSGSSIVTLLGFKLSSKPADSQHPFGHGRIEYISALIISIIIMLLGYEFMKSSIDKIIAPEEIQFSLATVSILLFAMLAKVWLCVFNNKLGGDIASKALLAISSDSRNDVIVTGATLFSIVFTHFTGIIIDGWAGAIVALILIYSGFSIAKDTLSPLLGEPVSKELADSIKQMVLKYDGIIGVHDLVVHNYGPGKNMATLHAEVPTDVPISVSHNIIEKAEIEVTEKLGITLVIHMDPIDIKDERLRELISLTTAFLSEKYNVAGAHDFRIVDSASSSNFIFELEIPHEYDKTAIANLLAEVRSEIRKLHPGFDCIINTEYGFIAK